MITDDQVERAFKVFCDSTKEMSPCRRCNGTGYHHGFGEDSHDPDWCEECGGSQYIGARDDKESMRLALEAALEVKP